MIDRESVADWDGVVHALKGARTVAVACHVNPDGDALGSVLATSLGLRSAGAETFPSWGASGLKVPPNYAFLPGVDSLLQPEDVPPVDVFLALDCGAADRLGDLEEAARSSPVTVNIDHHPGNENFGDLNIVITAASSTAEIMTFVLKDLGVSFDRDIATCLYTGIVTDTGRFQYSNSTPDVLRLAADLLEFDVPAAAIAHEVFESAPFGYLKLTGRVLARARLLRDVRLVYSWVTLKDLEETGVALDETEKLVDLVRSTRAADVAALLKEQREGTYRVSLRSKGPRSVGAIARASGGGGHELAAGFTADSVDAAVAAILDGLGGRSRGG